MSQKTMNENFFRFFQIIIYLFIQNQVCFWKNQSEGLINNLLQMISEVLDNITVRLESGETFSSNYDRVKCIEELIIDKRYE